MRFPPLFLVPDYGKDDRRGGSPALGTSPDGVPAADGAADDHAASSGPDYRHYTDEQLLEERERRRAQTQPTLRIESDPAGSARTVVDDRIDLITDELVRRARLRHPSARGRAG
jgi:hypothetical protein